MKKLLTISILLSISTFAFSQGGGYIGGGMSYSDNSVTTTIGIAPEIGFWLSGNTQVGLSIGYISQEQSEIKYSTLSPGLVIRSWKPVSELFSFYYGASVSYTTRKRENTYYESSSKVDVLNANVNAGIGMNVTEKLRLMGNLAVFSFETQLGGDDGLEVEDVVNISVGTTNPFNLGLYYTF